MHRILHLGPKLCPPDSPPRIPMDSARFRVTYRWRLAYQACWLGRTPSGSPARAGLRHMLPTPTSSVNVFALPQLYRSQLDLLATLDNCGKMWSLRLGRLSLRDVANSESVIRGLVIRDTDIAPKSTPRCYSCRRADLLQISLE